ncbi:hypothetical protein [Actinomadura sp. 3N407]|uniref:hypothetical protein n=1 Tax=Actinomadura sp. 3N407 TaxID=3457423 RepID=UPI003FCE1FC0
MKIFSRRMVGDVPEPAEVMWHYPTLVKDMSAFGRKAHKWNRLDADLKSFAHMAVASLIGCTWCLDLGYLQAHNEGLDAAKPGIEAQGFAASCDLRPLAQPTKDVAWPA